ncbi:unnamed protein product, partial [Notodromas monacha]
REWKPTSTKSRPETSSADEVEDIRLLAANHAKIDAIGLKIQKEILSATRYQVPPQDVSSSASSTFLQSLSSSSSNNSGYDGFVSTHDPALTFPTPPEFASKQPWSRHEGPPVSAENETLFDEALLHDLAETRQFRPDFQVGEFLTDAQRREEKLLEITNNGHDPYPESFLQKGSLANEYKLHAIHNTGIHPPSYIRKKVKKLFPESGNTEELYAPKRNSHRTNTQCSRKRSQALFKRDIQSVVMSDPVSGNLKAKDLPLVETPQNALPPQSAEKQPINSAEILIPKEVLSSLQGPEKAMKLMREEQKDLVSKLQMLQLHQLGVMKKHKQLQHALTPSVRPTTKSMENDVFDRMAAITTQSQKNHSANHMKSTQRPSTTVSIKKSTPGAISNHSSNSHSMSSSKSRENILEENLIDIMKTRGKFWNSEDRDDVTSEELDKHVEIRDSCLGQKRSPQNTIDPLIDAITDPKGSGVINSLEKEKLAEFQEAQRINNTVVELIMEEFSLVDYGVNIVFHSIQKLVMSDDGRLCMQLLCVLTMFSAGDATIVEDQRTTLEPFPSILRDDFVDLLVDPCLWSQDEEDKDLLGASLADIYETPKQQQDDASSLREVNQQRCSQDFCKNTPNPFVDVGKGVADESGIGDWIAGMKHELGPKGIFFQMQALLMMPKSPAVINSSRKSPLLMGPWQSFLPSRMIQHSRRIKRSMEYSSDSEDYNNYDYYYEDHHLDDIPPEVPANRPSRDNFLLGTHKLKASRDLECKKHAWTRNRFGDLLMSMKASVEGTKRWR